MKKGYSYIRISTEEQSHFSISGQSDFNTEYCRKHDIELLETFTDDGYSAESFNRPSWNRLRQLLSSNRQRIDFLIVYKYDRLIRNAREALNFVNTLEKEYNITLISVTENFGIDPHSPLFFKLRADLFVNAEYELRVITDRTKLGNWKARKNGRYLGKAPFGYLNARDVSNMPIIVIDKDRAHIVKQIFEDYANGHDITAVYKRAKKSGLTLDGNVVIQRMLRYRVYFGQIEVPAFKDYPAMIKDGLHEPIIDKSLWNRVQYRLESEARGISRARKDDFPLRGVVLCSQCLHELTGAYSKGKSKYYGYYKCNACRGENHSADKSHAELLETLGSMSLRGDHLQRLIDRSRQKLKEKVQENFLSADRLRADVDSVRSKLRTLEKKLMNDVIDDETFKRWKKTFESELRNKEIELSKCEAASSESFDIFEANKDKLSALDEVWRISEVYDRQMLLRLLFPSGLEKVKPGYRTPAVNSLFSFKAAEIKGLTIYKASVVRSINRQTPVSTREVEQIEHLMSFLGRLKIA